jgi:hypothetical protein
MVKQLRGGGGSGFRGCRGGRFRRQFFPFQSPVTPPFNFPDPFNFFMFGQNHTSFLGLVSFFGDWQIMN